VLLLCAAQVRLNRLAPGHLMCAEMMLFGCCRCVLQVRLNRLAPGDLVWKSRDPALEARIRESYESVSSTTSRKLPVQVSYGLTSCMYLVETLPLVRVHVLPQGELRVGKQHYLTQAACAGELGWINGLLSFCTCFVWRCFSPVHCCLRESYELVRSTT
jgi:hypothetical protein